MHRSYPFPVILLKSINKHAFMLCEKDNHDLISNDRTLG